MTATDARSPLFSYDDGSPTPPCRMCGRPRRRSNIGTAVEGLSLYCSPKGCDAAERICQAPGCGRKFIPGPGASKYCLDHSAVK